MIFGNHQNSIRNYQPMNILATLANFISQPFTEVVIDFTDSAWHKSRLVPTTAGWYFIETTTPLAVLQGLQAPPNTYLNSKNVVKKTRNFNLKARALEYDKCSPLQGLWLTTKVYSGMAQNLCSRAREHTFAHRGTFGLALANYHELRNYVWKFWYLTSEPLNPCSQITADQILLKLGEQIWRAQNGWPMLCAK